MLPLDLKVSISDRDFNKMVRNIVHAKIRLHVEERVSEELNKVNLEHYIFNAVHKFSESKELMGKVYQKFDQDVKSMLGKIRKQAERDVLSVVAEFKEIIKERLFEDFEINRKELKEWKSKS